jgi:polar amino acid transport system substrate-binding protein
MQRRTMIAALLGTALLVPTRRTQVQAVPADAVSSLAPSGPLRVAINYGNAVLARKDAATGALTGVSVDIANELARRLGVPLDPIPFDAAGKVSAAVATNGWDVAFLARDPERARDIAFTAPYIVINGTFVVHGDSAMRVPADVDHDGVRIAVSRNSIYDLFLTRAFKHATMVRAGSPPEAAALFQSQRLEVCAGVQTAMLQLVATDQTLRMLPEPFMQINQAMGVPVGRVAGARYLTAFVESIKADGFVQKALARNGQIDATVAPPAPAPAT